MKVRPSINPLNANHTKWSNTIKKFVDKLPTKCLSMFYHFVELALKGLNLPGTTEELHLDGRSNNTHDLLFLNSNELNNSYNIMQQYKGNL